MFDLFAPIPKDTREGRLRDYRDYLIARDGELNLEQRTLARREDSMRRFETAPPTPRSIDDETFRKNYVSFDKRNPPDDEILLLLSLVKINAAEAYGVSRNFDRIFNRASKAEDDTELRILVEEGYHTRILLSSANRYGIEISEPYKPPSMLRALIGGIATAPMAVARPLTLAGEILGTLSFIKLIEVTERVLKHDPETRDAVLERVMEICVDERGHISYNRLHMSAAELRETRLVLPMVARVLSSVLAELVAIGGYPVNVMQDLPLLTDPNRLPGEVQRLAFVA